ncbi:MAG: HD domain-containing protein, partial [Clostridia bacterium]|nr:HD domain-containing protein [Clostridia bacterium]
KERIFSELCKLLEGENVYSVLDDYCDVIFTIMPELEPMHNLDQQNKAHKYDAWHHTLHAVENIRADAELRLAMLFHDSGKPAVKTVDDNGVGHFYDHAKVSVEIARKILNYMKSSNRLRLHVCNLVEYHGLMPEKMSKKTFKKYIGLLGEDTIRELFEVREADVRALDSFLTERFLSENETAKEFFIEIVEQEPCFGIKDLEVDGRDLISLGYTADSSLGKALSVLLDEVMDNRIENEKNALLKRAKELLNENRDGQNT